MIVALKSLKEREFKTTSPASSRRDLKGAQPFGTNTRRFYLIVVIFSY